MYMPWTILRSFPCWNFWGHYIGHEFHTLNSDTIKWQRVSIVYYIINRDFGKQPKLEKISQIMSPGLPRLGRGDYTFWQRGQTWVLGLIDVGIIQSARIYQKTPLSCIIGNVGSSCLVRVIQPPLLQLWPPSFSSVSNKSPSFMEVNQ